MSQQEENDCKNQKHYQHHTIVNRTVENHQRFVAEEVEEQPHRHHHDEDDQRDRVPQEAKEENQQNDYNVIHPEKGDVRFHPVDRVGEVDRESD